MGAIKNFGHAGNTGDVLAALPALREYYTKTGIKPVLYLIKDHPAVYYEGAVHPVKDEIGNYVSLNQNMIDLLTPLLKEQDYLEDVRWIDVNDDSDVVQVNLSKIRDSGINTAFGDLRRWYFYILPELACDLSKQYIHVPDTDKDIAKGKTIICRTERYNNQLIDYSFLKEYEDDLVFSGTMREYNSFCMNFDLYIPKLNVENFLELAQALKQSNGLISNQTMIFQIAEGLKIPRAVEIYREAQNVIPIGEKAFDFMQTTGGEYYFHIINGTLDKFIDKIKNPPRKEG